jgi:DNA replication protein DnaC
MFWVCAFLDFFNLMFMAIDRHEANLFFQLINKLYGQTSIIITSNKGLEDWGDILGDLAITTAILDRLIHKSEVIHLTGDSYRLKHRRTIFAITRCPKLFIIFCSFLLDSYSS